MSYFQKYRAFSFVFILVAFPLFSYSINSYSNTKGCLEAREKIYALKFEEARVILEKELQSNPSNIVPDILFNTSECLSLFISENEKAFDELKKNLDTRLDRVEGLSHNSPWYLYSKAEIYFQWASIKIKFGEYYYGAVEIRKAFKMIEENDQKFPDFLPNKKYLGFMHAAIGNVPDQYKWVVSIAGFHGDLNTGIAELKQLAYCNDNSEYSFLKKETVTMLAFAHLFLQKTPVEASRIADSLYLHDKGPLPSFLKADIAFHEGNNEEGINILTALSAKHEYYFFPYLNYLLGVAMLHRLDPETPVYLNRFLAEYSGLNYIKSAYQKLGWFYFLKGDKESYKKYMGFVMEHGRETMDEDKQAQNEAKSGVEPSQILLRARVLFDGGYYSKALAEFSGTDIKHDFPTIENQLEVTYRIARVYQKLGDTEKAIVFFNSTIDNGAAYPYYFAANSSLQLGLINEDRKDYVKAEFYYRKCISLRNHPYQNSLDQKAKAGLARIKGK